MIATRAKPPGLRNGTAWSLTSRSDESGIALHKFPCQVGRHPGIDVRILDGTVSLIHAEIRREGAVLNIIDLGSRNGTFVNGKRLSDSQTLHAGDLVQFGEATYKLEQQALQDVSVTSDADESGVLAVALAQFEQLISDPVIVPAYQPIVDSRDGRTVAFEALARSTLRGLDNPELMFRAAKFFQMEAELSRLLRKAVLSVSPRSSQPHLFLNTHPTELADLKRLILSLRELRHGWPQHPITLEVHEAAALDLATVKMLRLVLTDLNMKLAYDDFGTGQARLHELVEARPDYLKFDRKLISGIDRGDSRQQHLVQSLVSMSRQLGITPLAEGVETAAEAKVCKQMGFELMQGFFFGRPASSTHTTSWAAALAGGRKLLNDDE